jgi:hypothetical protein
VKSRLLPLTTSRALRTSHTNRVNRVVPVTLTGHTVDSRIRRFAYEPQTTVRSGSIYYSFISLVRMPQYSLFER